MTAATAPDHIPNDTLTGSPVVALITGEYPPTIGGVGDYTALLAHHLQTQGTPVTVVTGRGSAQTGEAIPTRRVVPDWGLRGWQALRTAITATDPAVVHLQYQAGAFAGRPGIHLLPRFLRATLRPAPAVVVTFHDLCVPYLFPKAGGLRERALYRLAHDCAAIITTNDGDWQQLRRDPALAGRLHLLPIGSNIPPLPAHERAAARAQVRARLGVNVDTPLLAYFGLLSASKGVDLLLDALVHCPPPRPHLLLIGGQASDTDRATFGPASSLVEAITTHGLDESVSLTGSLPQVAVATHLAAADAVVLPYRDGASWRRGSLLAALAAGTPTITTRPIASDDAIGLLPSLTDGEQALLVPPGNSAALADAIMRLLGDAPLRARLVDGAQALLTTFDWATITQQHQALYHTLTQGVAR